MVNFITKERYGIEDLLKIMDMLRSEGGCPWDREQTHESIRRNFIEETYEVCEAIDLKDNALMAEELGDVLLQVVFHARIAFEEGAFNFDDVADGICKKLIVRHPHIFNDLKLKTGSAGEVVSNWEDIKNSTKDGSRVKAVGMVAKSLPALIRAEKVLGRAARAGYALPDTQAASDRAEGLLAELNKADDGKTARELIGEFLLAAVTLAKSFDTDPEEALSEATQKFTKKFLDDNEENKRG